MTDAYVCKRLGLTEKELDEASEEWVIYSLILLDEDEKAQDIRAKQQPR